MNTSIFDITGPVMVGPSSSHTAGAARLARYAKLIAAKPFSSVMFGLHGSFAKTYKGHGSDKAFIAGALGIAEDDERLRNACALAEECGLEFSFSEIELQGVHENSAHITFYLDDGDICEVTGSSVGGGQILITRINGFDVEFSATSTTLIIRHLDTKGVINELTRILVENDVNIGAMKLSRLARGDVACSIIETDVSVAQGVIKQIRSIPAVLEAQVINIHNEEDIIGED